MNRAPSTRILIVYSSRDGQTARIARRIAAARIEAGDTVSVLPIDDPSIAADLEESDVVIVGAGIRYGSHGPAAEALVRANLAAISARPNAFFSVSLSAGGPGARPANAARFIAEFIERTQWHPQRTASFAGALLYTKYNPFIRFMMKLIVGAAGGERDTSRDHEYTDWDAVERFAREVAVEAKGRIAA